VNAHSCWFLLHDACAVRLCAMHRMYIVQYMLWPDVCPSQFSGLSKWLAFSPCNVDHRKCCQLSLTIAICHTECPALFAMHSMWCRVSHGSSATAETCLCSGALLEEHEYRWLKYKFGGPGTLKKFGSLLQTEGTPVNLLVPLTAVWGLVWGLGTLADNYKGPRNGVPPYFNHWWVWMSTC